MKGEKNSSYLAKDDCMLVDWKPCSCPCPCILAINRVPGAWTLSSQLQEPHVNFSLQEIPHFACPPTWSGPRDSSCMPCLVWFAGPKLHALVFWVVIKLYSIGIQQSRYMPLLFFDYSKFPRVQLFALVVVGIVNFRLVQGHETVSTCQFWLGW